MVAPSASSGEPLKEKAGPKVLDAKVKPTPATLEDPSTRGVSLGKVSGFAARAAAYEDDEVLMESKCYFFFHVAFFRCV